MNLKDYFQFNKKERNGILLLSFILMIVILIYNNSSFFKNNYKTDFSNFEVLIPQKEQVVKSKDSLFNFNPNTLEDGGWILLGLSESKLKTLRNYQKSGVVFYDEDDLRKCYAISEEFAQKISGYAVFPKKKEVNYKQDKDIPIERKESPKVMINLNDSDSNDLISVSGIASFYAKQIINYRSKLGGFTSYNQFSEIWGLDKINLELVKSQTYIDTSDIVKININSSDASVLWNHPYINYKQANAIVNYRAQHGDFYRIQDIQKIVLIDSQLFRKIAPYLKTSD